MAERGRRGKTERPRDELGRLLPREEANRLHMEDFDSLPLEANHHLAREHFAGGRYFPAHEAWETCWKQAKGTPDEEFFKGLSQLGAGYTHWRRGNPHGARVLIRRGTSRIRPYGGVHHGVDVDGVVERAEEHARAFEAAERAGEPVPDVDPPRI